MMDAAQQARINCFIAAVLKRLGGEIHISEDEMAAVGEMVLFDDTGEGFTASLLPDYVAIGVEAAPPPSSFTDETVAEMLKKIERGGGKKLTGKEVRYWDELVGAKR